MTIVRAVIADDEALSRRLVHQLLARHPDVSIVGECADGAAARDAIATLRPDVMFLDIRMPLESGLAVAQQRDAANGPLVVFISAFSKFALPAFATDAVDYLTKPLTEERFDAMLDRVRDRLRVRRLAATATTEELRPKYLAHLVSHLKSREVIVPVDSIDYIAADDVYAVVFAGAKRHLVRASLDGLERTLNPACFARVHRSYIVQMNRVRQVHRAGESALVLVTGAVIPVSRRRRAFLQTWLKPFAT